MVKETLRSTAIEILPDGGNVLPASPGGAAWRSLGLGRADLRARGAQNLVRGVWPVGQGRRPICPKAYVAVVMVTHSEANPGGFV